MQRSDIIFLINIATCIYVSMRYEYVPVKYENLNDYTHWNLPMTNREWWFGDCLSRGTPNTRDA